ncbi:MAG: DUF4345 domain-containing protein [Telluria sp.]
MSTFARIYLGVSALAFVLIGLNTFHDPAAAVAGLELRPATVSALNEVRANYGGLQITIGLVLLAGVLSSAWLRPALWVNAAVTGGLIAGRIVSIALDGMPNRAVTGFFVLEIVAALIALALLWRLPRPVAQDMRLG